MPTTYAADFTDALPSLDVHEPPDDDSQQLHAALTYLSAVHANILPHNATTQAPAPKPADTETGESDDPLSVQPYPVKDPVQSTPIQSSQVQTSPAQSSPQSRPAQSSPAQPSPVQSSPVQFGPVQRASNFQLRRGAVQSVQRASNFQG